jgi:alpha-tubulin suppressor-like RCC1 family protein
VLAVLAGACSNDNNLSFREVSAGMEHTCALDVEGNVWCWGSNRYGQLGDGTTTGRWGPVPVRVDVTFRQVAAGSTHTCGVDTEGQAWCWGGNFVGKLGDGSLDSSTLPVKVTGLPGPVSSVSVTSDRSCAIVAESLWCWGDNEQNVFGIGDKRTIPAPTLVLEGGVTAHGMAPGRACTMAESLLCVGRDVGQQTLPDVFSGIGVEGLPAERFVALDAGEFHVCGRTLGGNVYCWWYFNWGRGNGSDMLTHVATRAERLPAAPADALTLLDSTVCTLSNGKVQCYGDLPGDGWIRSGGEGRPRSSLRGLGEPWVIPFPGKGVLSVSGGSAHICAVNTDAEIWCSGENSHGQLGDGTTTKSLEPVKVRS